MRFNFRVVSALAFSCILPLAFGQEPAGVREFEVASVKPAGPAVPGQVQMGVHIDGAQFSASNMSLRDLMRIAFQIKDYQISAPEWMAGERFMLTARIPSGSASKDIPAMLRALLADRFHLKVHKEKKEFSVYALVTAKGGARLKESPLDPADLDPAKGPAALNVSVGGNAAGTTVSLGHGASFSMGEDKIEARKMTLAALADLLARFVDRPVVDQTEVAGTYDLTLPLTPEDFRAMQIRAALTAGVQLPPQVAQLANSASGDSLHAGLLAAGLRLEARKAPLDFFVVEAADKTPSEN